MEFPDFDFARLIHPIESATFKRAYWERRPLVISRADPGYYRGLLTLAHLDRLLTTSSLGSQVRAVREGRDVTPVAASSQGPYAAAGALQAFFADYREGSTLAFQFLHERWAPLQTLCRTLATELSAGFQVNAYLTPARAQGFSRHYDTHDVFVLQVHGSKQWKLFAGPIRLPLKGQPFDRSSMAPGKLLAEFVLHEGDLAYVPRGVMHEAAAGDSTSLHLTVGVHPTTWATLILRGIESAIARDWRFRESLPLGFARDEALRRRTASRLAPLLARLLEHVDPAALVDEATVGTALSTPPSLDQHLLDLEDLPRVNVRTRVRRRADVPSVLTLAADGARLQFHGKVVQMPAHLGPELEFITKAAEFTGADLPAGLDDASKLVLVRRLLAEGYLTICRE